MKSLFLTAAISMVISGSAIASVSSTKYAGHELASKVTLTLKQARAAALKARPGRIVDQELEKESGGSGMRYSFDILSHGKKIEVGIDAMSGAILENGAESAAKESKETAQEAKPKN